MHIRYLNELLENNNIGKVEDLLMPIKFREWMDEKENELNDRVLYLHELYDVRNSLEELSIS